MLKLRLHINGWQLLIFALVIVAIIGPWWYDLINVPAQYPCSHRLYGDYCGIPMSGIWIFVILISRIFELTLGIFNGNTVSSNTGNALLEIFLVVLIIISLGLPLVSQWLLIVRGDRLRRQWFQIIAWSLSAGAGLWFFVTNLISYRWPWELWGLWLYIGLAVCVMIFEILKLAQGKRQAKVNNQSIRRTI